MGCCCKLTLLVGSVLVAWIGYKVIQDMQPIPIPDLPHDQWWGPGLPKKVDTAIRPFKINVSDKVLATLKTRLENVEHTPPLEGINFEYGFNSDTLKKVIDYWLTKYDWKQREVYLNSYPQFKTNIQGLDIHYIHVKPKVDKDTKIYPLLMVHGWPGSVREFYEIIPKLTTKRSGYDFVFELIIPSLPGYGFSQAAAKPGLGAAQISILFRNLMKRIGHNQYYTQGGDWGSAVCREMGIFFPGEVLGHHSNMCFSQTKLSFLKSVFGSLFPSLFIEKQHESKMFPLKKFYEDLMIESGYLHIQVTKPDTVGVGLRDSPAGLAAYILEKFTIMGQENWRSAVDGALTKYFNYEQLLDNVMIYYITGSITTSVRLYAESISKAQFALNLDIIPLTVPSACAKFPRELYQTDWQLRDKYVNLVQSTDLPRGGHFAAFEEPELLAADIFSAVVKFQEFNKEKNKNDSKLKVEM